MTRRREVHMTLMLPCSVRLVVSQCDDDDPDDTSAWATESVVAEVSAMSQSDIERAIFDSHDQAVLAEFERDLLAAKDLP